MMKKMTIKLISIALILSILIVMFSSCKFITDYFGDDGILNDDNDDSKKHTSGETNGNHSYHYLFPEGYTGGFYHQPGANIEYWWVETREEALKAIELLESHGSTFSNDVVLTYDGDLFDVKYCFVITGVGSGTEKIKWGDNPFDRYAENVKVTSYAFFGGVTIDEINHSYVERFDSYTLYPYETYSELNDNISLDNITISDWTKTGYENEYNQGHYKFHKVVYIDDQNFIDVGTCFYVKEGLENELSMTDEFINALVFG